MTLPDPRTTFTISRPCLLRVSPFKIERRGDLRTTLVGGLAAVLVGSTTADAAGMIRDAETEALMRTYAKPIFAAAGLGSQAIEIHIVNDRSFNAFVVDGHNMFIHAGALMGAKTPNEVIGVIAHESGHITGGHLARLRTQLSRAKSAALMLQLLGLAAMAAGALGGAPGIGQAGMGVAYGGQDAAMRSILAYRQDEESSADQAGVSFLNATHQSGRGMLVTFEAMSTKLIGVQGINPYLQSHPMPQQRLTQLRELVTSSPYYNAVDPPELQFRHDLVKAKLYGFLDTPEVLFNRYPQTDQSLAAQYARAIATYRKSGVRSAMPLVDTLIAAQPNWPYFYEIKGQFLFESGNRPPRWRRFGRPSTSPPTSPSSASCSARPCLAPTMPSSSTRPSPTFAPHSPGRIPRPWATASSQPPMRARRT